MKTAINNYSQKINALKLAYRTPINKNKIFILVEGDDDVKLYMNFFDEKTTKISGMDGSFYVEKALQDLNFQRLIGICDADFLHLEPEKMETKQNAFPNLFFTDFHDAEMMMVADDETFKKVMNEHNILEETTGLRQKLLKSLVFLSYIRWYNSINDLELSFEHLSIHKLYGNNTLQADNLELLQEIVKMSPNASEKDVNKLQNEAKKLQNDSYNYLQLCNGHDFMKITALYISTKPKGISNKGVESAFRLAYHISNFKTTKLFVNIDFFCGKKGWNLYKN